MFPKYCRLIFHSSERPREKIMKVSNDHSNFVVISTDTKLSEKFARVGKPETGTPLPDAQPLKFLKTEHLGLVAFDSSQESFYTIEKSSGEHDVSTCLHQQELFDGAVHIFNRIHPAFVLVDPQFVRDHVHLAKSTDREGDCESDAAKASFSEIDQFRYPFNSPTLLGKITDNVLEEKSVDIGRRGLQRVD